MTPKTTSKPGASNGSSRAGTGAESASLSKEQIERMKSLLMQNADTLRKSMEKAARRRRERMVACES